MVGMLYNGATMIYLGSDHAGHELKLEIASFLEERGFDFRDLGNTFNDPDDDYPDFAFDVAEAVAADPDAFGILVCGSAQGVCMAANKVKGIRAAAVATPEEAKLTREHNAANVLCLSGWKRTLDEARPIVENFIATDFSGEERHLRRINKISEYENDAR